MFVYFQSPVPRLENMNGRHTGVQNNKEMYLQQIHYKQIARKDFIHEVKMCCIEKQSRGTKATIQRCVGRGDPSETSASLDFKNGPHWCHSMKIPRKQSHKISRDHSKKQLNLIVGLGNVSSKKPHHFLLT